MFFTNSTPRSRVAILLLILLPILLQLPALLGKWNPDPSLFVGELGDVVTTQGGYPWIDPNIGFHGQALGKLSADQWLHGQVPWWNSFNGVGLPLAAEAQPASLFLPFTLLYHFRDGGLWVRLLLQIVAGLCTYAVLRRLKLGVLAAVTGAIIFELNGTFAWQGAPVTGPIAFLPMLILGVEQLRERINTEQPGGWWLIPLALAWSLYGGFPETAYIDGLLVTLWVLVRLEGFDRRQQFVFLGKSAVAVFMGLLCSLPLLIPFFEYLSRSYLGSHEQGYAHVAIPTASWLLSLMPTIFGPIFQYNGQSPVVFVIWANLGGYFTALQCGMALFGALVMQRRLAWVLLAWMFLCLGKAFDWRFITDVMNLIPLVKSSAFYRYSAPSWEFAGAVLSAFAVSGLQQSPRISAWRGWVALALALLVSCVALWFGRDLIVELLRGEGYRRYLNRSVGWMVVSLLTAMALIGLRHRWRYAPAALAVLLSMDALAAFAMPIYSGARDVHHVESGIGFLRANTQLQRFYSLGPIAPNYGAYFQIAQINYNYLPISKDWLDYVHRHLDPFSNPTDFYGEEARQNQQASAREELQVHRPAYEALGVKYVVVPYNTDPFIDELQTKLVVDNNNTSHVLQNEQSTSLKWQLASSASERHVTALAVTIATYAGRADGILDARICIANAMCAHGSSGLHPVKDNAPLSITLDKPLDLAAGRSWPVVITLTHRQSTYPMVVWVWPVQTNSAQQLVLDDGASHAAPAVSLQLATQSEAAIAHLVYSKPDMNIYELPGAKPYFEVQGGPCVLQSLSRVDADLDCRGSAQLIRREAYYPGWRATINGSPAVVERAGEIFQQVELGNGKQRVTFAYRPTYFNLFMTGFVLGLLCLLYGAWTTFSTRKRNLPLSVS